MCIQKINLEISEVLKNEYNEVIYTAWLKFIENTELKDGNLIVSVPNHYIKETFEERYTASVEELYKNNIKFNRLLVKTPEEEIVKLSSKYLPSSENSLCNISELVNTCIKDIYDLIEGAVKSGNKSVSCIFVKDPSILEELYWRVKEFLLGKGFKTELLSSQNNYTLSLSW